MYTFVFGITPCLFPECFVPVYYGGHKSNSLRNYFFVKTKCTLKLRARLQVCSSIELFKDILYFVENNGGIPHGHDSAAPK